MAQTTVAQSPFQGHNRKPDQLGKLRNLYWYLRQARECSTPSKRTWQRRIRAEKIRLLELGMDRFELHRACRDLSSRNSRRFWL